MDHKYFIDTNVLVSGLAYDGNESGLLKLAEQGQIEIVVSEYVLRELERVLSGLDYDGKEVEGSIQFIRAMAGMVSVNREEISVCMKDVSDKKDAPILAACIKSRAVLVTGDKKLAKEASKFVRVMPAKDILEAMEEK